MDWARRAVILAMLLSGCGCADRMATADRIGRAAGLTPSRIAAGPFDLLSYARIGPGSGAVVYIEGDGIAWINRTQLSDDPTPTDPTALRLAAADDAPTVLYLARPCQFAAPAAKPGCDPKYWSIARYAADIVDAMSAAIDAFEARAGKSRLELIGYSGGGVIATLLAAQRSDVDRVVTVAANLDVAFWTDYHAVTPLSQSLNPADFADRLDRVPQVIFVGDRDEIVPAAIISHYTQKFRGSAPIKVIAERGFSHDCCWAEHWPALLRVARGFPGKAHGN